jgi:hypothetical protein
VIQKTTKLGGLAPSCAVAPQNKKAFPCSQDTDMPQFKAVIPTICGYDGPLFAERHILMDVLLFSAD